MTIKAVIQVPESFRSKAAYALKTLFSVCSLKSEIVFLNLDCQTIPYAHVYYGVKSHANLSTETIHILASEEAIRFYEHKRFFVPKDLRWILSSGKKVPLLFHDFYNEDAFPLNDIVASAFFFLSDWQSFTAVSRDSHGRFACKDSIQSKLGINDVPVVDFYARILANTLVNKGHPLEKQAIWNKKSFAAVITHDFDRIRKRTLGAFVREFFEVPILNKLNLPPKERRERFKLSLKSLISPKDDYQTSIRKIFVAHQKGNSKPTVLLKSILKKHPNDAKDYLEDPFLDEILSKVKDLNGEIGLHSSYEAGLVPSLFEKEKTQLENRIKTNIISHRHHYLRYNQLMGLDIVSDSGILTDSTLGWAEAPGYRTGTTFPHYVFDLNKNNATQLLEIPLMLMDMQFSRYMETNTSAGVDFAINQVDMAEEFGGLIAWNFHHHIFDEAEFPEGAILFENSLNYLIEKQPLFLTMGEVYDLYKKLQS